MAESFLAGLINSQFLTNKVDKESLFFYFCYGLLFNFYFHRFLICRFGLLMIFFFLKFFSDGNETCDNSLSLNEDTDEKIQVEEAAAGAKKKENVDAILDPANFSMDSFHAKARVTKESFTNKNTPQLGVVKDPSDPLNQLDPLWSLAK